MARKLNPAVKVQVVDGNVVCTAEQNRTSKELWGLTRVLIDNMITGVTAGYKRVLDIQGVGYKVEVKGKELNVAVGLSHPVIFTAPEGITLKTETATRIVIEGIDNELVGRLASQMRKVGLPNRTKQRASITSAKKFAVKSEKRQANRIRIYVETLG